MAQLAVITGGTKGIGRALVKKFADNGFDIVTCSRSEGDLHALKTEVNEEFKRVTFYSKKADLADREETDRFVNYVKSLEGQVEVLINNTGLFVPGQVHQEEEGVLEQLLHANLYSAYHVTRGLVGDMIKNGHGHIFNMCSTASKVAYVNGGSYCIAKHAMYGMHKVLREELKDKGIRVTGVFPGPTNTASWEGVDIPEERFIKPEDVAESVYSAYNLSDRSVVEELLIRPQLGDL